MGLDLTGNGGAVSFGLFLAAYAFGGFFTLREALTSVRRGRFEVDFLMLVAAAGAAAIGRWEEGAVLLVLFSIGHALEGYALARARRSIESLADLAPRTALRLHRAGEPDGGGVMPVATGAGATQAPAPTVSAMGGLGVSAAAGEPTLAGVEVPPAAGAPAPTGGEESAAAEVSVSADVVVSAAGGGRVSAVGGGRASAAAGVPTVAGVGVPPVAGAPAPTGGEESVAADVGVSVATAVGVSAAGSGPAPTAGGVSAAGAVEVSVEELAVGDTVLVRPHTRVPADGFVVAGTSSVDQSPITGESVPADKAPVADRAAALANPAAQDPAGTVFAGSVNGAGALEVVVTRLARDNTLAHVVRMVQEADRRTSPTQRFTDRFQRVFVPAVLALVAALLGFGALTGEPFTDTFYRAMAVLVAASPCALAIATPAAVLSAVGRAARGGVLIKGGAPLEEFGRLRTVAFDKTGTLTEGRPRLTEVEPAEGVGRDELLRTALAVQRGSDHPLAQAVVRDAPALLDAAAPDRFGEATGVRALVGRGVTAELGGETVHIGSLAHLESLAGPPVPPSLRERTQELARAGRTTMVVRRGDRHLGTLALMDAPRPEAVATVAALRRLGVTRMVMLSGDDQRVADAVGRTVGMDEVRGGLLPQDKVAEVARLRAGGRTAMIGDGVNDAPAMAGATVGVAMGAAGSAVALETADIALMSDDLRRLPFVTGLSRKAGRIIRQNLWLSLGLVAVLVPATVLGLGIGPAVLAHEGSTLLVVANALRLLRHPD
ncbi:heavy metal translocating P-type ATPase [Streptomyces antimicrobicus]|uniref:Heavy metal translocating P-type ATPase n=1 Tax=Streptomyces antimicrobicus TaxID=2883108 RepID=A0ABS8BG81_9ACTN|nr:heavy metal translocating P-type ATPase [Streptomyces antimicrobicus]MCB5183543.1 heavy metal translocating P-type ATPase [Streptomyces antimicrobicus]